MSNLAKHNKRVYNSLIQDEKSVFKENHETQKPKVENKKKEKLPKPVFHKRQEKTASDMAFYGVLFLTSLVSVGINFYLAHFGAAIASIFGVFFSFYCLFFTNPNRWQDERHELAFWNVSVTLSVLIKSLHFNLFQWRKMMIWIFSIGLTLSYFTSESMTGVFGGLFLLTGLFFLAERKFEKYGQMALVLAWLSVPGLILSLILVKSISLGTVVVALLLYQMYERVKDLEIEEPYIETE